VSSTPHQQRSLYRRHRPRTFADVVGQEPVVRTLRNAVEREKVHHAYLFVGSRGTGKTSMAKILAACLNCERGPTIEPCGQCDSCRSIASASSLDVIEMDAASNNSVDDIRELRESVAYAPVSGRQKIYILDEAHMLSTAAWNAFLKTLEEPPPDTVFVLATTEAQKVPATVVDRCHRFDFHRPTIEQIAGVLRRVAEAEAIDIPPEAVAAVARSATGSFRDALGTLEQLLTYSGQHIALADVLAVLGVTDSQLLEETLDAIDRGDARQVLLAVAASAEGGRDAGSLARDLETRARELLLVQNLGEVPQELALTPEVDARLAQQAQRVGHDVVVRLLELLGQALEAMRAGADPRTQVELALVKAARPQVDGSMRALLTRIERLEEGRPQVALAPAANVAAASAPFATPAPEVTPSVPQTPDPVPPVPAPASGPAPDPVPPVPAPSPGPAPDPAPPVPRPDPGPAPDPVPAPTPQPDPIPAPVIEAPASATSAAPGGATEPTPPEPSPPSVPGIMAAGDLDSMSTLWPAVVDLVRAENGLLGAVIEDARPVELDGEDLTVAFAATAAFLKKKAEEPAKRTIVIDALREVTGRRLRLEYQLREELPAAPAGGPAAHTPEEWVSRFMDEFDAQEVPREAEPAGALVSDHSQKGD
jgi:DNA polymerase III subunit gamma/tau